MVEWSAYIQCPVRVILKQTLTNWLLQTTPKQV